MIPERHYVPEPCLDWEAPKWVEEPRLCALMVWARAAPARDTARTCSQP